MPTPSEKTRKQEIDLFLMEQKKQQKKTIKKKLSGKEKTKLQEIELFIKEQERLLQSDTDIPGEDFHTFERRRQAWIRQGQLEGEIAQQIKQSLEQSEDKYLTEKEFTDSETVQKMLLVKEKRTWVEKKEQFKVTKSKLDTTEKNLERVLFIAPDAKGTERTKKEVEWAKLQTAIIDSWQKGYQLDIEQTSQKKMYQ